MFDPFFCVKNVLLQGLLILPKFLISIDLFGDLQFCTFFLSMQFNLMFLKETYYKYFYQIEHFHIIAAVLSVCFRFKYFFFDIMKLSFPLV
jgi:hypothetical protein